jgi:hypothetical protein
MGRALGMRAIGHDVALPSSAAAWRDEHVEPRDLMRCWPRPTSSRCALPLVAATRNLIDAHRPRP